MATPVVLVAILTVPAHLGICCVALGRLLELEQLDVAAVRVERVAQHRPLLLDPDLRVVGAGVVADQLRLAGQLGGGGPAAAAAAAVVVGRLLLAGAAEHAREHLAEERADRRQARADYADGDLDRRPVSHLDIVLC